MSLGSATAGMAQSTKATVRGTARDASSAVVQGAQVRLTSRETQAVQQSVTESDGSYTLLNVEPGTYDLRAERDGFGAVTETAIQVTARQQLRLDVVLSAADVSQQVTVNATDAGTITTTDASIAASLSPQDVLNLPANYRGAGSTSPLNVLQTLPGIQPDSAGYPPTASSSPAPQIKFSLQGGLPSQSETTVDGISAQNLTTNNVQADAFPSAESIAEMRVDGVNNNAEFGQPGEITTVTKSGTDQLHGSLFWYFQNRAFDAVPFGTDAANKPQKVANDYGVSAGGPVVVPHLYDGRGKTFFFATYEGLRFPQSVPVQYLVPTVRMKQGDFSAETAALTNPFTGQPYQNATLPAINKSSAAFLSLFPDPNFGNTASVQQVLAGAADGGPNYNYLSTRRSDIGSNQFDARGDQRLGQKAFVFARYTWKNIGQTQPSALNIPESTAFAQYRIFIASVNYAFTPRLANEFRFGFTLEQDGTTNSFDGAGVTNAAGLTGIGPGYPFNGVSYLGFHQLTSVGGRLNSTEKSRLFQYVDNISWQKGAHTLRFGADVRTLEAYTPLDFSAADNFGNFFFSDQNSFTGQEFADFLIGAPYQTQTDTVNQNNDGSAAAYAFYAQDNWAVTPNLNVTYGLRYEFHPAFSEASGGIGNFDPSVAKSGTLIYPAGHADQIAVPELANLNACASAGIDNPYADDAAQNGAPCTPVVTNVQAGLPAGLRTSPKLRFEPRLGFAYRPFGNDRTAIRGGAGYYNITTSGALFYALTGTLQANLQTFTNSKTTTGPAFVFPTIATPTTSGLAGGPSFGSVSFYSAIDTHWHDPYSLQTNLSVDHDFGHGFGARVSYIGLKTWHLVWQPDLDMLHTSSTVRATDQPRSAFPFPNFYQVVDRSTEAQASYHSMQAELAHRFARGFSFNSSYTLAKNLADNQGTYGASGAAQSFVDEQGGYDATYSYDRSLDYGNVVGTRRHRFLTSGVMELPVGRGRRVGGGMGRLADLAVGGWQVSGIFLMQSGPFLTPFLPSGGADPSGSGSGSLFFRQQRPDRVANGHAASPTRAGWFNRAAFACPGSTGFDSLENGSCTVGGAGGSLPIGRFGTSSVGDVNGPGTVNLSTGLAKSFAITERVRLRAEGTFTNVLNHTNLNDPVLDTTNPAFGTINQSRGSDFGGNRTGQVSLKLDF